MILGNKAITIAIISWFIAQLIKVITVIFKEKRINFKKFIDPGGMPSSHSSLVTSLVTTIAMTEGFQSNNFAISVVFAVIVMYDAAGVRRAAGKQATALNRLIEEFYLEKPRVDERLKELLGHTPFEVLAGAILGILIAFLFSSYIY